jgi:tRNA (guanine-N7-)-methyltransferase
VEPGDEVRTYKARRRVTTGQAEALARLLPAYGVDLDRPFDAAEVFGRLAPLVLEIGSGMGEATAEMAAADPDRDLLAVEVHTPGIATLLRRLEAAGLTNVRVVEADAVHLLRAVLPAGSLDEVRIFFPDPWPKARHAKRRLLVPTFAELVASRLRTGGRLHLATDWESYARQALEVLSGSPSFELVGRDRGDRPLTRFETRGHAQGRQSYDVVAVRT